jgi:type III secretion protein L
MQRIKVDSAVLVPADGIVKTDFLRTLISIDEIERSASKRAEELIERSRSKSEIIQNEARRVGFAAGFDTFAEANQELHDAQARLNDHVENLLRVCLERILGEVPKERLLKSTLGSVLSKLRDELDIVIMIHPDNLDSVEQAMKAYRVNRNTPVFFKYEPNTNMFPDECLIYAGSEVIDISVPVMIEEMLGALNTSFEQEAVHAD